MDQVEKNNLLGKSQQGFCDIQFLEGNQKLRFRSEHRCEVICGKIPALNFGS